MNETESHSSSLSKFLKQLFFVFNGAGKKKKERKREKRKENSAFLKHYERPAEERQVQRLIGEDPGEGLLKCFMPRHLTKEERKILPLGHQEV